jgi:hypothetical protein
LIQDRLDFASLTPWLSMEADASWGDICVGIGPIDVGVAIYFRLGQTHLGRSTKVPQTLLHRRPQRLMTHLVLTAMRDRMRAKGTAPKTIPSAMIRKRQLSALG